MTACLSWRERTALAFFYFEKLGRLFAIDDAFGSVAGAAAALTGCAAGLRAPRDYVARGRGESAAREQSARKVILIQQLVTEDSPTSREHSNISLAYRIMGGPRFTQVLKACERARMSGPRPHGEMKH